MDSKWKGASRIALIDGAIQDVDVGWALILAQQGSGRDDERLGCWAGREALLSKLKCAAGQEAREGRCVEIGIPRTICGVAHELADGVRDGVDRARVDVSAGS